MVSFQFILDGYPRQVADGFPMVHDQIFGMDIGLSKCRQLLHLDVPDSMVSPAERTSFRLETGPAVRFFASLSRIQTVTICDDVALYPEQNDAGAKSVYSQMKKIVETFLDPSGRLEYELGRQLEAERLVRQH